MSTATGAGRSGTRTTLTRTSRWVATPPLTAAPGKTVPAGHRTTAARTAPGHTPPTRARRSADGPHRLRRHPDQLERGQGQPRDAGLHLRDGTRAGCPQPRDG